MDIWNQRQVFDILVMKSELRILFFCPFWRFGRGRGMWAYSQLQVGKRSQSLYLKRSTDPTSNDDLMILTEKLTQTSKRKNGDLVAGRASDLIPSDHSHQQVSGILLVTKSCTFSISELGSIVTADPRLVWLPRSPWFGLNRFLFWGPWGVMLLYERFDYWRLGAVDLESYPDKWSQRARLYQKNILGYHHLWRISCFLKT